MMVRLVSSAPATISLAEAEPSFDQHHQRHRLQRRSSGAADRAAAAA